MKRVALMFLFFTSVGAAPASRATDCATATILARVTVPEGEWSLADILAPGACPQLRAAASQVRLGVAPRPGSPRILTGENVRNLLEPISARLGGEKELQIPERIMVESDRPVIKLMSRTARGNRSEPSSNPDTLVKPGDPATLVWEQAGISVQLPVICLDADRLGQSVRARILNGSRILRAEVVGAGFLRVTSRG